MIEAFIVFIFSYLFVIVVPAIIEDILNKNKKKKM